MISERPAKRMAIAANGGEYSGMVNSELYQLLVIDDDQLIIDSLRLVLPKHWRMTALNRVNELESIFEKDLFFHAALIDMHLSPQKRSSQKAEGPDIIAQIHQKKPHIEIIAMSGDLSIELMELCLANGAQKFLAKPLMPDEVISSLEKIEALWMMRQLENKLNRLQVHWIGKSEKSLSIKKKLASLRGEVRPILIEGETGTGKEVAFKILNQQEPHRPFVSVNVAAIPENLFESELFGHVRGAFSGADQMKIGLAEAAHGGDLFLDEIEGLPLTQQIKLLRFLESGEVRKVGAKETQKVQVRVICASNQPLAGLVKEGKFREDLLYRLKGQYIELPPLRERKEDIPDLAQAFMNEQKPRINKTLSPESIKALQNYDWPGNVRELRRICEQLGLVARLPIIRVEDVHSLLGQTSSGPFVTSQEINLQPGLVALVNQFEQRLIELAIAQTRDLEEAAKILQISRSSIYKKIKDYGIDVREDA
jgi:DNA-binding NtrC family response regulator